VLAEVSGLSDAIQAWISSEPPPPADVGAENKA
jgi:hypothetical protein